MSDDNLIEYNKRFNNLAYKTMKRIVVADLEHQPNLTDDQAEQSSGHTLALKMLELIIDASIEATDPTHFRTRHSLELARIAADLLSEASCQAIAEYLARFDPERKTHVGSDFLRLVKIRNQRGTSQTVQDQIELTSDLHSNEGNAAHSLLIVSQEAEIAAHLMLSGHSKDYIAEKLRALAQNLALALDYIHEKSEK
ncbi:MAG: hypothetical protein ABI700_01315 [Chloroflexota bacterium]